MNGVPFPPPPHWSLKTQKMRSLGKIFTVDLKKDFNLLLWAGGEAPWWAHDDRALSGLLPKPRVKQAVKALLTMSV